MSVVKQATQERKTAPTARFESLPDISESHSEVTINAVKIKQEKEKQKWQEKQW